MRTSGIMWRDTARAVRFAAFDARALSGFALWMLHMSWLTFALSLAVAALFAALERFGVTPPAAWRFVKQSLFAPRRCPWNEREQRRRYGW